MFEMGSGLFIRDPQTSRSRRWQGLQSPWWVIARFNPACLLQSLSKISPFIGSYNIRQQNVEQLFFVRKNVFVDTRHTWISCFNIVPFRHFMVSLPSHGEKRGQKEAWGTLTMLHSKHNLANARLYCISNIGN